MRRAAFVSLVLACSTAATAQAASLYVNPAQPGCSDAASIGAAGNPATPWCSLAPPSRLARPGDVVHLARATYGAQLRPSASGAPGQPIVYQADGAVTIAAPAGVVSVMLTGVHDIVLRDLTIRAAALQAVWIDDAARVTLADDTVTNSGGPGVQIKRGTDTTITHARLVGSAGAGLVETSAASGTTLRSSTVMGNGKDGQKFNGDGVGLSGTGSTVADNVIADNGDSVGFEHGVYASATAGSYVIEGNWIGGNAGADIKAAGGPGLVADNRLESSMFGLVISDNPDVVTVEYNLIQGAFQHGVLVTTGSTAARARLWNNTVEQTGRSTTSGNASAVFVVSAARLELRNNLLAYTNPDLLGSALLVNDASLVGSFSSDTNWFASPDPRALRVAWNGARVSFAQWRTRSGQDGASIESAPPTFDGAGRVISLDLGAGLGTPLGLEHDLDGTPLGPFARPDIGAFADVG
jgi:Right handed beta helix region